MLAVSLDGPFSIAPLVFSKVNLQFLWIVLFRLLLRYSLTFIYSFSGLSFFDCSFGILQRVFVVQISTTKLNKYIVLPNDLYLLVIVLNTPKGYF